MKDVKKIEECLKYLQSVGFDPERYTVAWFNRDLKSCELMENWQDATYMLGSYLDGLKPPRKAIYRGEGSQPPCVRCGVQTIEKVVGDTVYRRYEGT